MMSYIAASRQDILLTGFLALESLPSRVSRVIQSKILKTLFRVTPQPIATGPTNLYAYELDVNPPLATSKALLTAGESPA